MTQTFEVSKDGRSGNDELRLIMPLSTVKLLVQHLSVPMAEADKPGADGRVAKFILFGSIIDTQRQCLTRA